MNDKRFVRIKKATLFDKFAIFVDTETLVQYIYINTGYGAAITPLIDSDGKPLIYNGRLDDLN